MAYTFQAHYVAVTEGEECWIVGFADSEFNTKSYLMLQRAFAFDDQDRELGMDTVYIERDDHSQCIYGGIEQCTLSRSDVQFKLSSETAKALNTESEIKVHFDLPEHELKNLEDGLERICRDKVVLIIATNTDKS